MNYSLYDHFNIDNFDRILDQVGGAEDYISVQEVSSVYVSSWRCLQKRFKIKFSQECDSFSEANNMVIDIFNELYQHIESNTKPKDKVRVVFCHPSLLSNVSCAFVEIESFSSRLMIEMLQRVSQSRRELKVDDDLLCLVQILDLPTGSGNRLDEYSIQKDCIKIVKNNDNLCALRAILICKAFADKKKNKQAYCHVNSTVLENKVSFYAKKLHIMDEPMGLNDIKKIEIFLGKYSITVLGPNGFEKLYVGPPKQYYLYIWYRNNHYNAITSMTSFYNKKFYCHKHKIAYSKNSLHVCSYNCSMCNRQNCEINEKIECKYCKKLCNNDTCHRIHQEQKCIIAKKCPVCGYFRNSNHVCVGEIWCKNCSFSVSKIDHKCFIKTEQEKDRARCKFKGYIFFDYEASQEKGLHEPNLVCVLKICSECIDVKKMSCFECCKKVFSTNNSFCKWLFKQSHCIAIAHNMKAYDGVFIMNYIVNNLTPSDGLPYVINSGSKLLSISYNQVKIKDSYSFIPIALSEFPNAFSIKEIKKGFFPHLFNTEQNQNYIGPYPSKEAFGYKFFSTKKIKEFDEWYEKVSRSVFNFKNEFIEYCWSDVLLLAEGCLSLRKIIIEMTFKDGEGVDPFQSAITIASLCHVIYRRNILKPRVLGYIPECIKEKNTSFKARVWLNTFKNVKHAFNGGEYKFGKYFVDGYDPINKIIYEFNGCYYHGCPKCFTPITFNSTLNLLMGTIHKRNVERIEYLQEHCNKLVLLWECEWDELVKNNNELKQMIKLKDFESPLNPRDALFGGRTNAVKLYHKCIEGEKIYYSDFTSLYPFVQKTAKYPIGHPVKLTENLQSIDNYFGIAKCKIQPPRRLYLPVLPVKLSKLVFSLCSKCPALNQQTCDHTDEERCITGTWCTPEILAAIEEGYVVIKIYEVWHFEQTSQYCSQSKTGGIFTDYINMFLKGKQEASGYPKEVVTEQDKLKYQSDYYEKEGVLLDIDKIEKNPGKRFVYKLALNSMWGRLGMNTDKTQYKLINNTDEWLKMANDDQFIISSIDMKNENILQVYYKNLYNSGSVETSVIHASMVTCYARLELYKVLKKLDRRILYFDTDSMIYTVREGDYIPKLGNYLGELTNEIDSSDGNFIEEFVSAGPKNYAYRTDKGVTKCTVKGFALNNLTKLKLNFDSIKQLVQEDRTQKIQVDQLKFRRDKYDWNIKTEVINQQYGFVYDKRVLFDDLSTLPYGY